MDLIIHGDDVGRSEARTFAIDQLIREGGYLNRTTLLVNFVNTELARKLAIENGYMDRVSFHLNLSEGEPLTTDIKNTGICKETGEFRWAKWKRIHATCVTPYAIWAIRREAEAQMKLFREMGFHSTHLDSHDWILFNYPVWRAVKPLLKKYGFETTRMACENWIRNEKLPLRIYHKWMTCIIKRQLIMNTDWAGGFRSFEKAVKRGLIHKDTSVEIMTHPEIVDGLLADTSNRECLNIRDEIKSLFIKIETIR